MAISLNDRKYKTKMNSLIENPKKIFIERESALEAELVGGMFDGKIITILIDQTKHVEKGVVYRRLDEDGNSIIKFFENKLYTYLMKQNGNI